MPFREYCCSRCGLIWFGNYNGAKYDTCPECKNGEQETEYPIYACDTFGWAYANEGVVTDLEGRGKRIHYHKDHPWAYKNDNH